MKREKAVAIAASFLISITFLLNAVAQLSNGRTNAPVLMGNFTHADELLPEGVFAWDGLIKATNATSNQGFARFTFTFTNISADNVTILGVYPSCGCTTAELPPAPWTLSSGQQGRLKLSVNLQGMVGTVFKSVTFITDKGRKDLLQRINILPPVSPQMTQTDRARNLTVALADRQAVFRGNCASCHAKDVEGKYGQPLFDAVCAICHEAVPRASMVSDLHNLKEPTTNLEFWRNWIASGKVGTLMPAFAKSQGGPLDEAQIASLAAYLNSTIPSDVPPAAAK